MDTLYIDCPDTAQPGGTLSGEILWNLDEVTRELTLHLVWWTSGKGTEDLGMVQELVITDPPIAGQQTFSFEVPEMPYSFSGKLISVQWGLDFFTHGHKTNSEHRLVISPTGQEVDISKIGA